MEKERWQEEKRKRQREQTGNRRPSVHKANYYFTTLQTSYKLNNKINFKNLKLNQI